jgi:hypothetical protein
MRRNPARDPVLLLLKERIAVKKSDPGDDHSGAGTLTTYL